MFSINKYGGRGHQRGYGAGCPVTRYHHTVGAKENLDDRAVYVADEGRVLVAGGVALSPAGKRLMEEKNACQR